MNWRLIHGVLLYQWCCFPADNWWCFVDNSVFTRMVDMYKSIVVFLLRGGKTLLVPISYENYFVATLRLLEKLHKVIRRFSQASVNNVIFSFSQKDFLFVLEALHIHLIQVFLSCLQVNLKAHHVEYNHFYIPDITSMVDIQEDYLKWFLSKAQIVSVAAGLIINFDLKISDSQMLYVF